MPCEALRRSANPWPALRAADAGFAPHARRAAPLAHSAAMPFAYRRITLATGLALATAIAGAAQTELRYLCTLPDGSTRSFAQNLGDFRMSIGVCRTQQVPVAPPARTERDDTPASVEVRTIEARTEPGGAGPRLPEGIAHWVHSACRRHGISPSLAAAVMYVESRFQPGARSPKGALGLMQVMRTTGSRYGVHSEAQLLDPQTNIEVGVRYLRDLLQMFPGRVDLAVAAYNAGEGAVVKHGYRVPPYAETRQYVAQVMALLRGSS